MRGFPDERRTARGSFGAQREEAYKRVEQAKATAKYMDAKVAHYETILSGLAPDDTNPQN